MKIKLGERTRDKQIINLKGNNKCIFYSDNIYRKGDKTRDCINCCRVEYQSLYNLNWDNQERLHKQIEQLEFKYNMLAIQYAKLQEQYQKVLKLAKENADSYEYCLSELEKDYEKATTKLVDCGFWNINGEYEEDRQLVENLEL